MSITNTSQTPNNRVVFPGQNGVLLSLHTAESGGDVKVPNEDMWKHIGYFTDAGAIQEAGKLYLQVSEPNMIKGFLLDNKKDVPTVVDKPVLGKRVPVEGKILWVQVVGPMQTDGWRVSAGLNRPEIRLLSWLSKEETKNQWITASTGGINDIPLSNSPESISKSLLHVDKQKWSVEWGLDIYLVVLQLVKSTTDKQQYVILYANEDRLVYHPGTDTEKKVDLDAKNLLVFTNKARVSPGTATGSAAQQNSVQQNESQTGGASTNAAGTAQNNPPREKWVAGVLFVLAFICSVFICLRFPERTTWFYVRILVAVLVAGSLVSLGLRELDQI